LQPGDDVAQGGLAAAALADQRQGLAGQDVDGNVRHRLQHAPPAPEPAAAEVEPDADTVERHERHAVPHCNALKHAMLMDAP